MAGIANTSIKIKEYRVIRIISNRDVIVNIGRNEIGIGHSLEVIGESEEIIDPLSNENLGRINVVKETLVVTDVYEKMCVCSVRKSKNIYESSISVIFFNSTKPFDVDKNDIQEMKPAQPKIMVGDVVLIGVQG